MLNKSPKLPSKRCAHRLNPSFTPTRLTVMRMRSPDLHIDPSNTASTPSSRPTCLASHLCPLKRNTTLLAVTLNPSIRDNTRINSSVNPSLKYSSLASIVTAYTKDGWKGYWSKWIQLHLARPAHREYYEMALAEARLGHAGKAWEWMEKSADQREVWDTWIKVDPLLESARAHPAYKQLLQRINLTD